MTKGIDVSEGKEGREEERERKEGGREGRTNGCMDAWMLDLKVQGEARREGPSGAGGRGSGQLGKRRKEGVVDAEPSFPPRLLVGTQFPPKLYGPGKVSSLYLGHELPGTTARKSMGPLLPLA